MKHWGYNPSDPGLGSVERGGQSMLGTNAGELWEVTEGNAFGIVFGAILSISVEFVMGFLEVH